MKVLVTGVNGQLGYDMIKRLNELSIENRGVDIADFDLTDEEAVKKYIKSYAPDVVVHCAAYTAVDNAEDNKELCFNVNVTGTKNVAAACKLVDAAMIYISTDYVFSGRGEDYFEAFEEKDPSNYYGLTKSLGEDEVARLLEKYFIVRVSWVFGINGNNFVKTMQRLAQTKNSISVVCDQIGSPTYTHDLAVLLCDMLMSEKYGVYHATNEGLCSWADFAQAIMEEAGLNCRINRITSDEYPSKARRPLNSRLDKKSLDKAGFERLPQWRNALKRYISEEKNKGDQDK